MARIQKPQNHRTNTKPLLWFREFLFHCLFFVFFFYSPLKEFSPIHVARRLTTRYFGETKEVVTAQGRGAAGSLYLGYSSLPVLSCVGQRYSEIWDWGKPTWGWVQPPALLRSQHSEGKKAAVLWGEFITTVGFRLVLLFFTLSGALFVRAAVARFSSTICSGASGENPGIPSPPFPALLGASCCCPSRSFSAAPSFRCAVPLHPLTAETSRGSSLSSGALIHLVYHPRIFAHSCHSSLLLLSSAGAPRSTAPGSL